MAESFSPFPNWCSVPRWLKFSVEDIMSPLEKPLPICPKKPSQESCSFAESDLVQFHETLTDGELYSGTAADFMGRDFAIFRTLGHHHPIRTEQHDSRWLNGKSPSSFVFSSLSPNSSTVDFLSALTCCAILKRSTKCTGAA